MPFWNMFLCLKQMFDAKILIKRLPSFSVPKITIIRHVKPSIKKKKEKKKKKKIQAPAAGQIK